MTTPEKTALFISPHLDDAVFSCGGTLAKLRRAGWKTVLCTIFTKSVAAPQGFALACQLDKNLPAEIDYMKLRRSEDFAAANVLNVAEVVHLNFPEAPHRGYDSAPELFGGIKAPDEIWRSIGEHLAVFEEIHQPSIIFAPQGLGNHCDHLQTIKAVVKTLEIQKVKWYFDTPYIIRQPDAPHSDELPPNLEIENQDISEFLELKIRACAKYASQIGFQFGGESSLKSALTDFHRFSDGSSGGAQFTERFLTVSKEV